MRLFKSIAIISLLAIYIDCSAQKGRDEALAESYYQNGEYEKAAEMYETLWEKNQYNENYYRQLYNCNFKLKRFEELEKITKKQIKQFSGDQRFIADLYLLYVSIPNSEKGNETLEKLLKNLPAEENQIRNICISFESYRFFDEANNIYSKGEKSLKKENLFQFEKAKNHLHKKEWQSGVSLLINTLEKKPEKFQEIKSMLQDFNTDGGLYNEAETQLYGKIQKQVDNEIFVELLTWIYVQNKDFEGAIIQMKSLDKRKNENGIRIIEIARLAQAEGAYDDAISGFEYVVAKGNTNPLYIPTKTELLNCRKEKISKNVNVTKEDLLNLKNDYKVFIAESGKGFRTATSMKELADLEGFFLHETDSAILICEELIKIPGVTQMLRNQTKLSLGDFYLMNEDPWNATLLYSQVDKEEKDSPLGEEARFRNAKLSYYEGDFEWAQTQLQVLKASTSELISNDAINLSVFIIDNSGLDTIYTPIEMYAKSELLLFQNKINESKAVLDSIKYLYPGHVLWDDIEYSEAMIHVRQKNHDLAIPLLEDILKNYGKDLKGDDATFLLGEIYQDVKKDNIKAMEYYKSIIENYSNSLLIIEARKRYRILRGDKLN